jgi:sugar O-acyltransferase (sialic acid O-acetyltransferase NeuD family)
LLVLSPLLVVIGVSTAIFLGRPILFRQQRPGLGGKPFTLLKFRTMTDRKDPQGNLLDDDARLSRFGRFLRSTSLDELPELWNILVGEMSLVGPRPLLTKYLPLYSVKQARRHEVRPGLTGWAQVNGRNAVEWSQRIEYDVWYVDNFDFWLDCKIFIRTLFTVMLRKNISAANCATMPEFQGVKGPDLTSGSDTKQTGVMVIGAGGHAKVVIATLQESAQNVAAVYDDDPTKWGTCILGIPILGAIDELARRPSCRAIIAVGDNSVRQRIATQLQLTWISVVHPKAYVHDTVEIGTGVVVCAGAVLQPDAKIGNHAIINTAASVDHDSRIEDFAHIGPGAHLAGNVFVGKGTLLGIGSQVNPGIKIHENVIVGAGAAVITDLSAEAVAIGIPARATEQCSSKKAA